MWDKLSKKYLIVFLISLVLISGIFVFKLWDGEKAIRQKYEARDTLLLASFNVLRLGDREKDYETLSRIVARFDIVGLEEVMTEAGVKKLKAYLEKETGEKWDYMLSEHSVGSERYREYYAYIYRKGFVNEAKKLGFYAEKDVNDFMREPYGAYFKVGDFDFIFVLAHSIFGDAEKHRVIEASRYARVYEYFYKNFGEDDVILAGDFNLPASDLAFRELKERFNVEYLLEPEENLTTFSNNKLISSYDNFFINKKLTSEYTGNSGVYNFLKNNNKYMKENISDHLPIYSEYKIR